MTVELDIRQCVRETFRRRVHQILAKGYSRLVPSDFLSSQEPAITGELCRAMNDFLADHDAPAWSVQFAVRDDPKINVSGRQGDGRPRIDIEVESVQRGQRPLFRFEAKRLGLKHPIGVYLGADGLGAFLDGYYPVTHPEAGMLGYLQMGEADYWIGQIQREFCKSPKSCRQVKKQGFARENLAEGIATWRSVHKRSKGTSITIFHTMLRFW